MNRNRETPGTASEGKGRFGTYPWFNSKILHDLNPWFPLLLLIITFGVYFNNFFHEFTYDDQVALLDDPRIWQWDIWAFVFHPGHRWPLVIRPLTFMVDYSLFGFSPLGYQLHNLIWHSLCVVLAFYFLRKITREATFSFFGALIFAIHPIHVEAVSNIANRKELLALAFILIAFLCYIRFLEENSSRKWGWVLAAGLSWGLGLGSKQVTIILPLLLVAYELLLVHRDQRFLTKNIFLLWSLVGLGSLALTLYAHFVLDITNFKTSEVLNYTLKGYVGDLTYLAMIATSARAFWNYLQLLVWPSGLCPNHVVELSTSFFEVRALLAWLGMIAFIILALTVSNRWPVLAFGMLWIFIGFLPVSNWVPSAYVLADRYMYTPSVGYSMVLVALAQPFYRWLVTIRPRRAVWIVSFLAAGLTFGYTGTTLAYNRYWSNQETLMNYMLQCNPISPQAYNGLGIFYLKQGQYTKAVQNFTRAIELGNVISYSNRGNAYYQLGKFQDALNDYNQSLALKPKQVKPYINRGTVFYELGEYQAALKDYNYVISLRPDWGEAYLNRGILYLAQKKYELAVEDFSQALEKLANQSQVLNARGLAFEKLGHWKKAEKDYHGAILSDPSNGEAFFNLGRVQLHNDDIDAAIRSYEKAKQLGWERAENVLRVLRNKGYVK